MHAYKKWTRECTKLRPGGLVFYSRWSTSQGQRAVLEKESQREEAATLVWIPLNNKDPSNHAFIHPSMHPPVDLSIYHPSIHISLHCAETLGPNEKAPMHQDLDIRPIIAFHGIWQWEFWMLLDEPVWHFARSLLGHLTGFCARKVNHLCYLLCLSSYSW